MATICKQKIKEIGSIGGNMNCLTEEDILSACEKAFRKGWNVIKLYFMIGLPTETDKDLDGIADLANKILDDNKTMSSIEIKLR